MGTSPALMNFLIETTDLASVASQNSPENYEELVNQLYNRIHEYCYQQDPSDSAVVGLHCRIFQLGVLIYFHRAIFNSVPLVMATYVNELLGKVKSYQNLGGGYVAAWPVFVAAAEVYKQEHMALVHEWLDEGDRMGVANRRDIRALIQSIWDRRMAIYEQGHTEQSLGEIIVDWREITRQRNPNILIV